MSSSIWNFNHICVLFYLVEYIYLILLRLTLYYSTISNAHIEESCYREELKNSSPSGSLAITLCTYSFSYRLTECKLIRKDDSLYY